MSDTYKITINKLNDLSFAIRAKVGTDATELTLQQMNDIFRSTFIKPVDLKINSDTFPSQIQRVNIATNGNVRMFRSLDSENHPWWNLGKSFAIYNLKDLLGSTGIGFADGRSEKKYPHYVIATQILEPGTSGAWPNGYTMICEPM